VSRRALDTPMMRQYLSIKAEHPDAIVFYRMGDFYEMFLGDAELAAPLLDIALTTRDKGKEDAVAMCGVPVHAADQHVKRLAELGHRVAICEQVEDARAAGGRRLVRREVIEVVTPGLVGDPAGIEAARELVLVALAPGAGVGMAALDASTGDLRATEVRRDPEEAALPAALVDELRRIEPREIVVPGDSPDFEAALGHCLPGVPRSVVQAESYDPAAAPVHPDGLSPDAADPASRAAAALLAYVNRNQPAALVHTPRLRRYALGEAMILDEATRLGLTPHRDLRQDGLPQRRHPGAGSGGHLLPDGPYHLRPSRLPQLPRVERRDPAQQLVEHHPQRVHVGTGVDVRWGGGELLRAQVPGRSGEQSGRREDEVAEEELVLEAELQASDADRHDH